MPISTLVVTGFQSVRPAHAIAQSASLAWLAEAHTRAEATLARREGRPFDEERFREHVARRFSRFGCPEGKIASRGHALRDCAHTDWDQMEIYRLHERPEGEGMLARTRAYEGIARRVFERMYAEEDDAPADLVHVTCTGYASPSAAQELVAAKGWGDRTRVTHAYHMGCYAAFPALRIAAGLALADEPLRPRAPRRADVVHTELCSLHMNPLLHDPEQLVVQSLFADGFVRYRVCERAAWDGRAPALTLVALDEVVAPDSSGSMRWICSDWGMRMTLARDVPDHIRAGVRAFVDRLCAAAGLDAREREAARYAVHPGGPKILDQVRDALGLDEAQMTFSREALRARGNMSSATVPHVWMDIARAPAEVVPNGAPIVSLAFGPGLTMCGAVLRKGVA